MREVSSSTQDVSNPIISSSWFIQVKDSFLWDIEQAKLTVDLRAHGVSGKWGAMTGPPTLYR